MGVHHCAKAPTWIEVFALRSSISNLRQYRSYSSASMLLLSLLLLLLAAVVFCPLRFLCSQSHSPSSNGTGSGGSGRRFLGFATRACCCCGGSTAMGSAAAVADSRVEPGALVVGVKDDPELTSRCSSCSTSCSSGLLLAILAIAQCLTRSRASSAGGQHDGWQSDRTGDVGYGLHASHSRSRTQLLMSRNTACMFWCLPMTMQHMQHALGEFSQLNSILQEHVA